MIEQRNAQINKSIKYLMLAHSASYINYTKIWIDGKPENITYS